MSHYTIGRERANLYLFTYKEGALSAFGHDLKLEIRDFQIKVDRISPDSWKLEVDIKKDSFYPVAPSSLSDSDKRDIQKNIVKHLPDDIRFEGELTTAQGDLTARGELSIGRRYRTSLSIPFRLEEKDKIKGKVNIRHSYLGIKPFRAPLGLIKVKDEMLFTFEIDISEMTELAEALQ